MAPTRRLSVPAEAMRRQDTAAARAESGGPLLSPDPGPAPAPSAATNASLVSSSGAPAADAGRMTRIRAMFLGGLDGWVDDDPALVRPWGFDLGRITVPVSVWFGGRDTRVPRAHADWLLAHVPAAEGHEYPGGHEPGDADFGRILAWIAVPAA
jgi:pimeloyl-ACP methyl ester carboxylesterase